MDMKNYFSNWSFMRVFRLVLGIIILAQGIDANQWLIIAMGAIFTLLALTNSGCGMNGSCAIPPSRKKYTIDKGDIVEYEEVK